MQITPEFIPVVPPAPGPSWRAALLWGAFVVVLATGLVLALRFGAAVPALLDGAPV